MKRYLPAAIVLAFATVATAAIADDTQTLSAARGESAEIVHVQPRGRHFVPHSSEDDDIQKKLADFNAAQQLLDAALDKKLMICRRC